MQFAEAGARHLPNLDGLRTIAAILVVLQHSNHFPFVGGAPYYPTGVVHNLLFNEAGLAVQFFFVLSGFLITRIVLNQFDQSEGFRVTHFWLRRVARIWPVYFCVLALAAVLSHWGPAIFNMQFNSWPLLFCFLENFDLLRILHEHPNAQGFVVSVLWSVSIEEQFYFVYPLLLLLVPRRHYGVFFGLVVVGSGLFKLSLGVSSLEAEFHTLSACYELGMGCLLAWLLHGRQPRGWPPALATVPYLALFLSCMVSAQGAGLALLRPVIFGAIIYDQAFSPKSWLQTRYIPGLNAVGKMTYGLYSYHMVMVIGVYQFLHVRGFEPQGPTGFLAYVLVILSLALAMSWTSYNWMERPLMAKAPR